MQRESIRRGFSIHQKVVLEIDFSGVLWGYTEITIVPTSVDLKTIHLHSRQCVIHSVTVGSHTADFIHRDPLSSIYVSSSQDCHNHPELKRKVYSALAESDEGELSIGLPNEVHLKQSGHSEVGILSETDTPEPQTPGVHNQQPFVVPEFLPITINISYSLRNPVDGFQFVLPTESYPYRVPHAYTTPSSPDSARCWVPCVDNLWEKCTWEFEFIVPRYLEERESNVPDGDEGEGEDVQDANPTIVVCSGEFVEQVAHPNNSNKTIFLFSQPVMTSAQHIAFAAGPFHVHSIPVDNSVEDATGPSQPSIYGFCLPGHEAMLRASVSSLRPAMNFYSSEYGSYPFGSYKVVAVDEMPTQRFDSSTLTLITSDLLHGDDAIEQAIETRHALSHALACQWIGINILQKTWSDTWLVNGLGLYIAGLFIRKFMGNNEYRFRLKKDMQRVLEWDNGSMPPICEPQNLEPPDSSVLSFVNLKAPLILHILDRRMGKSGTSLGLSRVLPKVFLSAISGEMTNNLISTNYFLRTCRKVSGVDLRTFADQWIYGSGCPAFAFTANFNRKKMAVEITMRQDSPAFRTLQHNDIMKELHKPVAFFEGTMTIRIHEADGTPYEHVLDIRSPFKRYEVPFNTKYKRIRRTTKRYLARQAAAQAAAEGDAEAAEAMGLVDMGFGLEIWEKEEERENWKVADWTEEDEQIMSGATYEWIRMDADFEWIASVSFDQPDFMWVSQLQRDRDVVAQLEALHALSRQPTAIVSSTLTKTVLVTNYYFRIRCEAAMALVHCAIQRLNFLGLFHLFKLFLRYCYDPENQEQDLFDYSYVPKPNDFSDLPEYFVRKSLINAISRIRFDNGKSPAVVRGFLVDQLRYNDNTANPYSDAFYICTIISAAACANVCTLPPERGELLRNEVRTEHNSEDADLLKRTIDEVERYKSMDRLIPSSHNAVTIAALEFYLVVSLAGLIPNHPRLFFPLTREGNYTQVRIAAFDGLFMTKWYTGPTMRYVLAVMANDPSRVIRRHVARSICPSFALLATLGEMKASIKESESLLIEEDGNAAEKTKEAKKSDVDMMIKVLRKDREVGKNEVLREFLMPIALAPDVDHEVRFCALKIADILIRGVEESPPKVLIHLPPTPVTEAPQPLPIIKPKPSRVLKSGGPPQRSPHPTAVPPTPVDNAPKINPLNKAISIASKAKLKGRPPKINKPLPKAQSGGMSSNDLKACRNALKKLLAHKSSFFFRQPVDPIRDHAPNYFDIIKEPMDLSTMGAKLEEGMYNDRSAFVADFHLMISNAKKYNVSGSYVHNETIVLESYFEKQWARILKTLEAAKEYAPDVRPKVVPPPSFPSSSTTTRSTIKLKVGGTQNDSHDTSKPKPRARRPKDFDVPPPPYVDDGSHDLLQEVIAIEQEQIANRHRSGVDKDPGGVAKHAILDDDDFLALASPSKETQPLTVAKEAASSASKQPLDSNKAKKDKPGQSVVSSEASAVSLSRKGKEKEVAPASNPPKSRSTRTLFSEKKCKDVLKAIMKLPEAAIFARPVDPVLDGCPTYLDEIAHPMDFGTISKNVAQGVYLTMEEFAADVELVFGNCRTFNPPLTYPVTCADVVEKVFRKEWMKAMEKKLTWQEKRGLQGVVSNVIRDDVSWVFREPVDPAVLGIPTYFDIIPRKDARDLKTIRQKLDTDKYDSTEAFEADVELMIQNAMTFNGAESEVGKMAVLVRNKFKELVANAKSGTATGKKRKDTDGAIKSTPQPPKKLKVG